MFPAYVSQTSGDFPSEMWSMAYTSLAASPTSFLATLFAGSLLFLKVKVKVAQSCRTLCDSMAYVVHGTLQARILEWVAFPFSGGSSQPRSPTLQADRQILYQLSHEGSPRILKWVAYPFCSGSSRPRNQTWVSCIVGGFFTN